jgi:hypothetical protein
MTTTEFPNYAEMLVAIKTLAEQAAEVEGAEDVGCFLPIRKYGTSRATGDFSSLGEWLADVATTLEGFLIEDGEELEGWDA